MNGKDRETIEKERNNLNLPKDYEVLNSILICNEDPKHRSVWYLAKSLEILAQADLALFMKGWEKARGCKIEHLVAQEYGIPISYEE